MPKLRVSSKTRKKKSGKQGIRAANTPAAFEAVRRIAVALDKVEEGTSYGTPAFKVGGKLFVRMHQDG